MLQGFCDEWPQGALSRPAFAMFSAIGIQDSAMLAHRIA
jgi:hypothetical protein